MKTRTGFVSNSSSSSFVVIGLPMTKKVEKLMESVVPKEKDEEEYEWQERFSHKTGLSVLYLERPTTYIVGKILADVGSDGDYLEYTELTRTKIEMMMDEVVSKLGGGDIEPKLMLGTRPS